MTEQAKRETHYTEAPPRAPQESRTGPGEKRGKASDSKGPMFIILKNVLFWGSCALSLWALYLLFLK